MLYSCTHIATVDVKGLSMYPHYLGKFWSSIDEMKTSVHQ